MTTKVVAIAVYFIYFCNNVFLVGHPLSSHPGVIYGLSICRRVE